MLKLVKDDRRRKAIEKASGVVVGEFAGVWVFEEDVPVAGRELGFQDRSFSYLASA